MKIPNRPIIQRQPELSEQVYTHLRNFLQNQELLPGEVFPSETELSKSFDVSRAVIREALSRMKHDGLLESRKGGRTHIAMDTSGLAFRTDAKAHTKEHYLTYLYEMRAIIEPEAAALAAMRATPEALGKIKGNLKALKKAINNNEDGTDESLEFHKSIIDASGNPHFAEFINWVGKKVWAFIRANDIEEHGKMISDIQKEHMAIVDAIESHDFNKARKITRKHVLQAAKRRNVEIVLPE